MIDLGERELLAQLVALPTVSRDVESPPSRGTPVQLVQLLLDCTHPPLLFRRAVVRFGPALLPHVEDSILDESHVARRWLQQGELVNERAFQFDLAHIDRAALALAMVVRVVAVPALRPAPRQRTAAGLATHKSPERKIRMIPRSRSCHDDAAIESRITGARHVTWAPALQMMIRFTN
jgi:hypothetical protein